MAETDESWQIGAPAPALRPYVRGYVGYRSVQPPGIHRGLPSAAMTFIISLADDIEVLSHAGSTHRAGSHGAVIGGLQTTAARIARGGLEEGVAIDLTPLGSRALLGRPAADLAELSVDGWDVLADIDELRERMGATPTWPARFRHVDRALLGYLDVEVACHPALAESWRVLEASGGKVAIGEVARHIGWSRRHLATRFQTEFGLTPKAAARVIRFGRVVERLRHHPTQGLAPLAIDLGYFDQSHLTNDFTALAGCSPTRWLTEEFPFFQDADAGQGQARPR